MWITSAVSASVDRERFFIFSVLHNDSQKIAGLNFLDRVSGYDLQSLHQCLILFRYDLQRLLFCKGPAEASKLQPFVKEKESVAFPYKSLDTVTASATEEEENEIGRAHV